MTYEEARAEAIRQRAYYELQMLDRAKQIADEFSERLGLTVEFDFEPLLRLAKP